MRWGTRAAGILPVAFSTGRVLLTLRSSEVHEPGTWGLPGGKAEAQEDLATAAVREMREELRYGGPVAVFPSYIYREPGFIYQNFVGVVDDEFVPRLNWENDDARWFALDALPEPLHFGTALFLQHGIGDVIAARSTRVR